MIQFIVSFCAYVVDVNIWIQKLSNQMIFLMLYKYCQFKFIIYAAGTTTMAWTLSFIINITIVDRFLFCFVIHSWCVTKNTREKGKKFFLPITLYLLAQHANIVLKYKDSL